MKSLEEEIRVIKVHKLVLKYNDALMHILQVHMIM